MKFVTTRLCIFFSLILFYLTLVIAGTTGKIAGRIIDEKSGEPVVGATVMLIGTSTGAASDVEGNFVITNLVPGSYSISISAIGYRKKIIQRVQVNVDFTTRVDEKVSSELVDLDAVVVVAEKPLVRRDLTSTQSSIDAEQIRSIPVESISGILTLQAGIIQGSDGALHFRGGRSDEVAYTLNGVSINNPFTNSNSITIATNAIQELSVVQGTFNAEYGNALSGVVETGLKEGGDKYTGQISFYTGDRFSSHKNIFFNIDKFNPTNHSVSEGSFGGPVPFTDNSVSFFLSGRFDNEKGWLYGIRQSLPEDRPNTVVDTNWIIPNTGDGAIVPMNPSKSLTITNRLTFRLSAQRKINYDFIFNEAQYKSYSHSYKYNPEGTYNNFENDALHMVQYSDWIDDAVSYSLKLSYNKNIYEQYRYKDLLDEHYVPSENSERPGGTGFFYGGAGSGFFERKGEVFGLKFDAASQISSVIDLKIGGEAKFPQMYLKDITIVKDLNSFPVATIPPETDLGNESYAKFPKQYSGYAQSKMEFENIVLNAGVRFDYFNANSDYAADIYNPQGPRKKASEKISVSPRLGVSFQITDKGFLHFSYGHFFQMPQFRNLYVNKNYEYAQIVTNTVFGNADLNPQQTITYEFGLQQQLTDNLAVNVTGFYKDVRDLFAVQTIRISENVAFNSYVNKDYSNVKGFTISLMKRRTASDWFGASLDYTYQAAEGNDVSANAFYIDKESGRESEKKIVVLDWDQTHTLNGSLYVGELNNWNISILGKVGAGLPYTPTNRDNDFDYERNAARKPSTVTVDMVAQKELSLMDVHMTLFFKVYNLFDTLNELNVYDDTGRSTYTLAIQDGIGASIDKHVGKVAGVHSMSEFYTNPLLYSSPREVRVGIALNF